jgi:hypothetical protein
MAILEWDKVGDRAYETGLDRGVLYLSDGKVVPWNGLTSIVEKFDKNVTSVYYDGTKISDLLSLGDFEASLKAITYPDEFINIDGYGFLRKGMYIGNQAPKTFNLSYRTQKGNDVEGNPAGYKIHILYNLTAIPSDRTYSTLSDSIEFVEFEWDITSIPQEIGGFRPTAHVIFDSNDLDPDLLVYIEGALYGTEETDPFLVSISDLISFMYTWARIEIIDHGDGTWTANCQFTEDLVFNATDPSLFTINNATVVYLDSATYDISNTMNTSDV